MKIKDEPIAEIREIRHQISQEFDNDSKKYIDYLKGQRNKYIDQMIFSVKRHGSKRPRA